MGKGMAKLWREKRQAKKLGHSGGVGSDGAWRQAGVVRREKPAAPGG